ncbi:hypothetical protein GGI43DRAFT_389279 [Trichoderma evansii]
MKIMSIMGNRPLVLFRPSLFAFTFLLPHPPFHFSFLLAPLSIIIFWGLSLHY